MTAAFDSGSFESTAFEVGAAGVSVTPGSATLTLNKFAPAVTATATVTPTNGAMTLSGQAPVITAPCNVAPGAGLIFLSGYAPDVQPTADAGVSDQQLIRWRRRGRR